MIRRSALAMVLCALSGVAYAQTVWRCGPDGRSYADSPCADGRQVAVADPRTPADRAQAHEVAQRERQLAQQLVDERRARERDALMRGSGLAGIKPAEAVNPRPAAAELSAPHRAVKKRLARDARPSRTAARATRRTTG